LYLFADRFMRQHTFSRSKRWLWVVPPLLGFRRSMPVLGSWPAFDVDVPDDLRSVQGIRRRPEDEERAAKEAPLRDWVKLHSDTHSTIHRLGWAYHLATHPRRLRVERMLARLPTKPSTGIPRVGKSPEVLTRALKARAAELGISATGVAAYDPKYTYVEHMDKQIGNRVVICALENDWEATQAAPSNRTEKAKLWCNMELQRRLGELQQFLVDNGYQARVQRNELMLLHYAVEAGLGQMGLNGQVLTPHAGSRCRMQSLITDAPLLVDEAKDYGIPKICDACQVCVRRCPAAAITFKRAYHRGVEKAKINTSRCAPTVAKAQHCAVCIKVCPVQRYGLAAVVETYESTGRILGKDSAELESYEFEGYVYGPGERPSLGRDWFAEVPFDKAIDETLRWHGGSNSAE
jgi:epoxyqueuosine reductase